MKSKFLLAAISAPLLFGGMQTSAFAACALSSSSISCDVLDVDTSADALDTILPGYAGVFQAAFNANSPSLIDAAKGFYTSLGDGTYTVGSIGKTYSLSVDSPKFTSGTGSLFSNVVATINNGIAYFSTSLSSSASAIVNYTARNGTPIQQSSTAPLAQVSLGRVNVTPVPGPEAGAGLGALTMAGMAVWLKRRRKDQSQSI